MSEQTFTAEQLETLALDMLTEARSARAKGLDSKAHGIDTAAAMLLAMIESK